MEVQYNPETGSGEVITRAGQQPAEQSLQERADIQQAVSFRNTSQHLQARSAQKNGYDPTAVGGTQNLEMEQALQQAQLALHRHNTGAQQVSTLEHLQLQQRVQMLAERLVTGESVPTDSPGPEQLQQEQPAENPEEVDDRIDELNDLRDTLRNDDALNNALDWASETLDDSVTEAIRLRLNNENPDQLKQGTDLVKTIYNNRESIQTVDSGEDVGELSDAHLQYFESNFGAETARNIALINHGIRTGKLTMGQATSQSLKLGILQPMLQAAREFDDFNIANF